MIGLRKRPFHTRPPSILPPELHCLLTVARGLDRLVLLPRSNAQASTSAFRFGTVTLPWSVTTDISLKLYHYHVVPIHILCRFPRPAHLALRTDRLPLLPIDSKLGDRDASGRVGLPGRVVDDWPNHGYVVVSLARH